MFFALNQNIQLSNALTEWLNAKFVWILNFGENVMQKIFMRMSKFFLGMLSVLLVSNVCFADASNVSSVVSNIQSDLLTPLLNVIVSISYLAGAGFIVGAIFKFKAHKDNPTQVTVGTPVMMLFVGIGLLFFPVLVQDVMKSIGFSSTGAGSLTFTSGSITT